MAELSIVQSFITGQETTSNLLSFTLVLLIQHPDILERYAVLRIVKFFVLSSTLSEGVVFLPLHSRPCVVCYARSSAKHKCKIFPLPIYFISVLLSYSLGEGPTLG